MKLNSIEKIVFDLDGTLYKNNVEYNPGKGSIKTSQLYFRFAGYDRLNRLKESPEDASAGLIQEYQEHMKNSTIQAAINSVPDKSKKEYNALLKEIGSNSVIFEKLNAGPRFLHGLNKHIDFDSILVEDKKLQDTIKYLKKKGYELGMLTAEVFDTVQKATNVLGISLNDFKMKTGTEYPVLCGNNVTKRKPDLEGFNRIKEIYNVDPEKILFIGDSVRNDITPALRVGFQAMQVNTGIRESAEVDIDGKSKSFFKMNYIYVLRKLM